MKVKLKEGVNSIANAFYEINPGQVVDIPEKLFDSETMDKVGGASKPLEKPKSDKKEEVKEEKKSFKQELIDLHGVGPKIAEQILRMAKTKEGLAKIPRETLIEELRDDVVEVLDKYLGR